MMGHDADRGIISLTMEKLFSHLESMESDHVIEMQASYFEIYNENILDLLRPGAFSNFENGEILETRIANL